MLLLNRLPPERAERIGVGVKRGSKIGVGAGEHLSAERLGVVVGDGQAHPGRRITVTAGIGVGPRDDKVPAKAQQRFKRHFPGAFRAAVKLPAHQQRFIVQKPAAPTHLERGARK